jgi:hypothetical protein
VESIFSDSKLFRVAASRFVISIEI